MIFNFSSLVNLRFSIIQNYSFCFIILSDYLRGQNTYGIALLCIGIVILPKIVESDRTSSFSNVITISLILIYGISYVLSPKSYELNKNNITINRPFDKVVLNCSDVKNILKLEKGKLAWSIRTFGSGGLFGYFGKFWNKEFGSMTWYATRRDKAILIITNEGKKIVLTPEVSEKFIFEFKEFSTKQSRD